MATVATDIEPICYLLPEGLQEWGTSCFFTSSDGYQLISSANSIY